MYESSIKVLQELVKSNQDKSKEIGFAIGLLNFCMSNKISSKDIVFPLPIASEDFGYFTVQECTENGDPIETINDESGNPLEIISEALIVERKLL